MSLEARIRSRVGDLEIVVELVASRGETLAVIGPNGAGKTTTLRALAGLHRAGNGRVVVDGHVWADATRSAPPQERSLGIMFQDHLLFPNMTALDNVAYGLRSRGVPRGEAAARAAQWLRRLEVDGLAARRPSELSGGESGRVALARALVVEPALLLLDEPLSALDARSRAAARRLLAVVLRDYEGVAVLVTHDPVDALTLGDRIVVMEAGRVVQEGSAGDISLHPRSAYAASLVGLNFFRGEIAVEGDRVLVSGPWGRLVVARPRGAPGPAAGDAVIATVQPASVAISRGEPAGSPRNVLRGEILAIDHDAGRARLSLGTTPGLTAEITTQTLHEMRLQIGETVWATVKATEIAVYPA